MHPRIFITESYSIPSYSLFVTLAIIIAVIVAYGECKRYKIPVHYFPAAAFWAVLGGIIGAKVLDIIFYQWADFLQHPMEILTRGNGWMYYGAELGGVIALIIYLLINHIDMMRPMDIGGTVLMLAHAIGRMGCFLTGCCYGIPTNSWIGIKFPDSACTVHPTQLYESIPLSIAFCIFWIFRKRFKIPGTIYATYLVFYGLLRFVIEFYREDAYTFGILHLSPSQYISLAVICTGVLLLRYAKKRYFLQGTNKNG
jgi:phosphatidylglycerol---prolipoprotein diacylglyceryl transferase